MTSYNLFWENDDSMLIMLEINYSVILGCNVRVKKLKLLHW